MFSSVLTLCLFTLKVCKLVYIRKLLKESDVTFVTSLSSQGFRKLAHLAIKLCLWDFQIQNIQTKIP